MKKIWTMLAIAFTSVAMAQETVENDAFRGKNDLRLNIGANIQHGGTGITASLDKGFGESFSLGVQAGYLLGINENLTGGATKFEHRFDAKVRASANLGDVIGFPQQLDIYPGLNVGLKNFGGHIGARYFFGKGFGVFTEAQFPLARFNKSASSYRLWNNQFAMFLGVSFDLGRK